MATRWLLHLQILQHHCSRQEERSIKGKSKSLILFSIQRERLSTGNYASSHWLELCHMASLMQGNQRYQEQTRAEWESVSVYLNNCILHHSVHHSLCFSHTGFLQCGKLLSPQRIFALTAFSAWNMLSRAMAILCQVVPLLFLTSYSLCHDSSPCP